MPNNCVLSTYVRTNEVLLSFYQSCVIIIWQLYRLTIHNSQSIALKAHGDCYNLTMKIVELIHLHCGSLLVCQSLWRSREYLVVCVYNVLMTSWSEENALLWCTLCVSQIQVATTLRVYARSWFKWPCSQTDRHLADDLYTSRRVCPTSTVTFWIITAQI